MWANSVLLYLLRKFRFASSHRLHLMFRTWPDLPMSRRNRPYAVAFCDSYYIRVGIARGYCNAFFVVDTGSERGVHFRCEEDRQRPLGLNRFDAFQLEQLGTFIFLHLRDIGSSSIWCEVDCSCIFRRYHDPMRGCLNLTQVPSDMDLNSNTVFMNSKRYFA